MTVTVAVVDDYEIVRRGVAGMLREEPGVEVVAEAATYTDAATAIPAAGPDVAVLDVRLGGDADGVDLCGELAVTAPGTRCVLLTAYPDGATVRRAYDAGAAAVVVKEARGDELVATVRRVARGERPLDAAAVARWQHARDEKDTPLTPQEVRVVALLSEGLTNRDIAAHLGLSDKTVKNYVSNVLAKLGMAHRSQLAVYGARMARRSSRAAGAEGTCRTGRDLTRLGS